MKKRSLLIVLMLFVLFATPVLAKSPEYKISVYPIEIYNGDIAIELEQKSDAKTSYTLEGSLIDANGSLTEAYHFTLGFGARRYIFDQDMKGLYLSPIFLADWDSKKIPGGKSTSITVMGVAAVGYQLILGGHVALDASIRGSIPFYHFNKVVDNIDHETYFEFVPSYRIGAGITW